MQKKQRPENGGDLLADASAQEATSNNPLPAALPTSFAPPPPPPGFWKDKWPRLSRVQQELFQSQLHRTLLEQASFQSKLYSALLNISETCAKSNQSIYQDASKRHQMLGRIVHVATLAGPRFSAESEWSVENQQLFKMSYESLTALDKQRQWIILHIHGAGKHGMLKFFIPIEDTEYILIYDKKDFALQLSIIDEKHHPIYFQISRTWFPNLLQLAIGNYMKTVTPEGHASIEWKKMVAPSRLLANSSRDYLKYIYYAHKLNQVSYMTGRDGDQSVEVKDDESVKLALPQETSASLLDDFDTAKQKAAIANSERTSAVEKLQAVQAAMTHRANIQEEKKTQQIDTANQKVAIVNSKWTSLIEKLQAIIAAEQDDEPSPKPTASTAAPAATTAAVPTITATAPTLTAPTVTMTTTTSTAATTGAAVVSTSAATKRRNSLGLPLPSQDNSKKQKVQHNDATEGTETPMSRDDEDDDEPSPKTTASTVAPAPTATMTTTTTASAAAPVATTAAAPTRTATTMTTESAPTATMTTTTTASSTSGTLFQESKRCIEQCIETLSVVKKSLLEQGDHEQVALLIAQQQEATLQLKRLYGGG